MSNLEEQLRMLAERLNQYRVAVLTEEATKMAFVIPFIGAVLGYDVFNPEEVVPEFTADVGIKRGEKVDYAIMRDGEVSILIECKKLSDSLRIEHSSQLYRYFSVTKARIAILTNGAVYRFYTDLDAPNIMDDEPFLVLDLSKLDESSRELHKLARESFDIESMLSAAEEMKHLGSIKRELRSQFSSPSNEFTKLLIGNHYNGRLTRNALDTLSGIVSKALDQFLAEEVQKTLNRAMDSANEEDMNESDDDPTALTADEFTGFQIVKAIACNEVAPGRVSCRKWKTYLSILLDDTNRKPVARLYCGRTPMIGFLDENRMETKHRLADLDDLYLLTDEIKGAARRYLD